MPTIETRQTKGVELSPFQTGGSEDLYQFLMQHPGFLDFIRRDGVPLEPQWVDDVDFAILTYLVFDRGKNLYY